MPMSTNGSSALGSTGPRQDLVCGWAVAPRDGLETIVIEFSLPDPHRTIQPAVMENSDNNPAQFQQFRIDDSVQPDPQKCDQHQAEGSHIL